MGVMRTRNEDVTGTLDQLDLKSARCLGHVLRIDSAVVGRAMLRKELPGLRPEQELTDGVGEDTKVVGAKDRAA